MRLAAGADESLIGIGEIFHFCQRKQDKEPAKSEALRRHS
jgi:hypothetical protein